jgi:uncharacterized protein
MTDHHKLYNPTHLKQLAKGCQSNNRKHIEKLKLYNNRKVDEFFNELHEKYFNEIDCLQCANCCRTLGPRLINKDIERIAKYLGMKSSIFIDKYLLTDEDHDFVYKSMPCPFLQADNCCSVYDFRPKACREYPHTDQNKILGIIPICLRNTSICPVVFLIINELSKLTSK